jgi:hypothetical protein
MNHGKRVRGARAAVLMAVVLALPGLAACGDSANGDDDPSPRDRVLELFQKMSEDFHGGRPHAFCEVFGTANRSLDEFTGDAAARTAQCTAAVARTARKLKAGKTDWPAHRLGGVTFPDSPDVAFLKVVESDGASFINLQFTRRGGKWYADFSIPDELEGMNAE